MQHGPRQKRNDDADQGANHPRRKVGAEDVSRRCAIARTRQESHQQREGEPADSRPHEVHGIGQLWNSPAWQSCGRRKKDPR